MDGRCTARNRRGGRCGRRPIRGGRVCHFHGGAAPQVKAAARRRLDELTNPVIAGLARIIETGTDDMLAIRAGALVLKYTQPEPTD